jgi:hypothetical protein
MKILVATLLLLVSFSASAVAPKCYPDLTLPISFQLTTVAGPVKVGEVVYAASQLGVVWGYACVPVPADGNWYHVVSGGLWVDFPVDWLSILDKAVRGTQADRDAAWLKYATNTVFDPRLQPDVDAIKAKLPLPPPPPPSEVWKVLADPFRADKRRVVYTVVAGKRGAATTQTVAANDPCDPVTKITEFGPVYFLSVLGNPALIARCVKQ